MIIRISFFLFVLLIHIYLDQQKMPSPDAVICWYLEMEDHNQNINNDNDKEKIR